MYETILSTKNRHHKFNYPEATQLQLLFCRMGETSGKG